MKTVAAALLFLCALVALAGDRSQVSVIRGVIEAEAVTRGDNPKDWVVIDTGEDVDLGEGPGPVVEIYRKDLPHSCLVAVHPKQPLMAVLMCGPRAPRVDS